MSESLSSNLPAGDAEPEAPLPRPHQAVEMARAAGADDVWATATHDRSWNGPASGCCRRDPKRR